MRPRNNNVETLERIDIIRGFVVPGICVAVFNTDTFREDMRLLSIIVIGN